MVQQTFRRSKPLTVMKFETVSGTRAPRKRGKFGTLEHDIDNECAVKSVCYQPTDLSHNLINTIGNFAFDKICGSKLTMFV